MKNNILKLIALLLSIALSFSLLSACSDSDKDKESSSNTASVSDDDTDVSSDDDYSDEDDDLQDDEYYDEYDEDYDDEYYDDEYYDDEDYYEEDYDDEDLEDDDYDEDEDYDEEDLEDGYVYNLKVYNDSTPLVTNYQGASGSVYHAYGHMKDDSTGRVYTDEQMELELSRLVDSGIHYARTRYHSKWIWDGASNSFNFNSNRANYFFEYCKNMQDRDISVLLTFGWHLGAFTNKEGSSIGEVSYLQDGEGSDIYGEMSTYDYSKIEEFYNKYGTTYKSPKGNTAQYSKSECLEYYKSLAVKARRMASFYAETLKQAKARGLHNISHFLYFTEPSYEIKAGTTTANEIGNEVLEGLSANDYLFFVMTAKDYLTELGWGSAVKHMGPQQGSINHGDGLLRYVLEREPELFDVYDAHLYPSSDDITNNIYYDIVSPVFESYVQPLKDVGVFGKKEFWVDEFYCRATNATGTASAPWRGLQNVICFITAQQYGVNNFSIWQIFDQLWTDQTNSGGEFNNGIHAVGSTPSLFISTIPRGQYYLTSLFSKYNGYQNGTCYKTNVFEEELTYDGLYMSAVKLDDGNWTITLVNCEMDDIEFEVDFESAINKNLYRHVENANTLVPTTAGRLADADKTFVNVKDKFTDTIKGGDVVIYTSIKG